MINFKTPLVYIVCSAFLGASVSYYFFHNQAIAASSSNENAQASGTSSPANPGCNPTVAHLGGFNHVKPVLFSERDCESERLDPIKRDILSLIDSGKQQGLLSSASIYLQLFSKDEWTSINGEEHYHPASLNKVAVMITYLHAAESNAGNLLNQKVLFEKHDKSLPDPTILSKTLQPGQSYTIMELLHYMIAYSDNDATQLLLKHIDLNTYNKTFTDLGLPKPTSNFDESQVTAKEYSVFMKVLYNASYLSIPASEYGTNLLTECDFKDGLLKNLPANTQIAHKFGECRYDNVYELHESGIIYVGENAYLITIMTKGTDRKNLTEFIGHVSGLVYGMLTAPKNTYF